MGKDHSQVEKRLNIIKEKSISFMKYVLDKYIQLHIQEKKITLS